MRDCGMPHTDRIVIDPKILTGKPVIRGTRLAVEFILEFLAADQSENDILTLPSESVSHSSL